MSKNILACTGDVDTNCTTTCTVILLDTGKEVLWQTVKTHSVRVYSLIISKYATKIVGTQKRKVACVHGTQDQKQLIFNTLKPAQ